MIRRPWGPCAYCETWSILTREHIIPRSRKQVADYGNLLLVCKVCNANKGSQSLKNWVVYQREKNGPYYQKHSPACRFLSFTKDEIEKFYQRQSAQAKQLKQCALLMDIKLLESRVRTEAKRCYSLLLEQQIHQPLTFKETQQLEYYASLMMSPYSKKEQVKEADIIVRDAKSLIEIENAILEEQSRL